MTTAQELDPLTDVLQRLEQQLELPYVSGDLDSWSETVRSLTQESSARFRQEVAVEHPQSFGAILKSNQRQQVDKLREDDGQILAALENLTRQTDQFAAGIDETALASRQFQPQRERLVNDALALVLSIRRQRAAISTWLGEALQRDNGVGD